MIFSVICLHARYEDAFTRFVDEVNGLAAYQWWEGSVYSILCILAYPLSWSWLKQRRRKKLQRLREFVRSEYDHACLRSCRSRALYEGLKVYLFTKISSNYIVQAFINLPFLVFIDTLHLIVGFYYNYEIGDTNMIFLIGLLRLRDVT